MIADKIAQEKEYYAIIKWDSLGQVSSQTLKNMFVIDKASETLVLRPLISENKQDIIVNVNINYCAEKATTSDDMTDALNYRTITKRIIALVENNRFSLLEKLTNDILSIAAEHDWVDSAEVEVDKPHALRFADSVSLCLGCEK